MTGLLLDTALSLVIAATPTPPPPTVVAEPTPTAKDLRRFVNVSMTPEQYHRARSGMKLITTGIPQLVVGGIAVLGIGLPASLTGYRTVAGVAFVVGGALAVAGTTLVAVGVRRRSNVRKELSVTPIFGPRWVGASARFRF